MDARPHPRFHLEPSLRHAFGGCDPVSLTEMRLQEDFMRRLSLLLAPIPPLYQM